MLFIVKVLLLVTLSWGGEVSRVKTKGYKYFQKGKAISLYC